MEHFGHNTVWEALDLSAILDNDAEVCGNCFEVLDCVQEAFDEAAVAHGADVGPGALFRQTVSPFVAVVGPVAEEGLTRTERAEHIVRGAAVMSLTLGQLEGDGAALGIDRGMDLGGQAAARATHATGSGMMQRTLSTGENTSSLLCRVDGP